jgi:hypothetical protein
VRGAERANMRSPAGVVGKCGCGGAATDTVVFFFFFSFPALCEDG